MKRCMVFTMILLLFFTLALPVYADVPGELPPDSLTIDDATKAKFQLQPGETIYRIYAVSFLSALDTNDNIADYLISEDANAYYVIYNTDGEYRCVNEQNEPINFVDRSPESDMAIFRKADNAIYKVSADIVVHNAYYLSAGYNMGKAIYYVTDKGDYVFFSNYNTGSYLFPKDAFCKLMDDQSTFNQLSLAVGGIVPNVLWDLSVFDIDSEDFDINARYPRRTNRFYTAIFNTYYLPWLIPLGAVAVVGGIALFARHRKKKYWHDQFYN